MLICLLTRLGGIPYAFFMCTAYYCGHLETVSPLFSTLVEKCQIIKGALMRGKWGSRSGEQSCLLCAQRWTPLSAKASTIPNYHSVTTMSHSVNSWWYQRDKSSTLRSRQLGWCETQVFEDANTCPASEDALMPAFTLHYYEQSPYSKKYIHMEMFSLCTLRGKRM